MPTLRPRHTARAFSFRAWMEVLLPFPGLKITSPEVRLSAPVIMTIVLGSACAAFLNAASNALNQIYDLEIDRVNKPKRPLVTGEISMRGAWIFTWITYAIGLLPTWLVVPYPYTTWAAKLHAPLAQHECFFIYLAALVATFMYSAPALGRTKAHPIGANLTIAIPRGCLLKVAGWTMVAPASHACFHRSVPSAGATLVTPPSVIWRICGTPAIVTRCGEL